SNVAGVQRHGRGKSTGGGVVLPAGTGIAIVDMVSPPTFSVPSRLPENEVNHPAAADVNLVRIAAVVEDVVVVAARVLERVREDRHRPELARIVHLPGEGKRGV